MIKFLDLKRVNQIIDKEIHQAIEEVLASGWYIMGNKCKQFEENLAKDLGGGYAVGCNSGTDAISLSLRAGGVCAGDEVITVSHTAIPTISAIVSLGARPVFVDICKDTWVMDVQNVAAMITEKTKAIVCVHLYGNMVDVIALKDILKKLKREDIVIVEDVAQAQGAFLGKQQAGTMGDFAAFSFYPSKNIGALGDGGAVFTHKEEAYHKLLMYRNYGQKDRYNALVAGGLNSRLDEIQAAVLDVKLKHLHSWNRRKSELMDSYRELLKDLPIQFQAVTPDCIPGWHLCVVALNDGLERDQVMSDFKKAGLETLIHYPHPTHIQKAFSAYGPCRLENTEDLAGRIISLPLSYVMARSEIEEVSDIMHKCLTR